MKRNKTFYISTPIYYPSGNLHIGHVLTTTLAWVYRNYKKQQGYETFFVTGIDEHGQKIQKKAEELNILPQKYVDAQKEKFENLWNLLHIDYDYFSRTTNLKHEAIIQKIFQKMLEKKIIYKGNYEGLYSINDEEFLTKSQAIKKDNNYYHPTSGHLLQEIKEESYFFNMSSFTDWILKYFKENPNFLSNKAIEKELINNFLNKGLEDLSITRVSFDWGIKLDKIGISKHVIYVWLDALFNYLTALNYLEPNNDNFVKFWEQGDERVHILGKEISRFHAIYWPIFLKSLDLKMPTKEIIHSWIITPEGKMSKSKGNVIDPIPLIKKYGFEEIKYFFASQINLDSDYAYSEGQMVNVLNADLANNVGNLINRTIKMVNNSFSNGTIYDKENLEDIDKNIYDELNKTYEIYKDEMNKFYIDKAMKQVLFFSSKLNEYIDITKPWTLKDNLMRLNVILNTLLNGIYLILLCLNIIMPIKTNNIFNNISLDLNRDKLFDFAKFNSKILDIKTIFFERIKN